MTHPPTIREYYRHIVSAGRRCDPTFDEIRADYRRALDAWHPGLLLRI